MSLYLQYDSVAFSLLLNAMPDYRKLAEAAGLGSELCSRVVPPLEHLDAVFRPLAASLPMTAEPDIRFAAGEDPK